MFYPDNGLNTPHTHALIIGVGGYPHLSDGETPNGEVVRRYGTLTQITSAPRTAARLAEWVVAHANDWDVPLGSVDVLISPVANDDFAPPVDHEGNPPTIPTFANIQQAYLAWKDRCDRHQDNIALFYFCGHGSQLGFSVYLLCQDFGASPANIWEGAFDFTLTRDSFHTCNAERQFLFVDACRTLTLDQVMRPPSSRGLEEARKLSDPDAPFNFTQFAAPKNESAVGPVKGVSYYASALMKAMDGAAAKKESGRWVVTTGRLVDTLEEISGTLDIPPESEYVARFAREIGTSSRILQVPLPQVTLTISCQPEEANAVAKLSLKQYREIDPLRTQRGGPMHIDVQAGIYDASAEFEDSYSNAETSFSPNPPSHHEPLECW